VLGIHDYWLFVLAGVLLNLTPGQDTFYILGSSIAQGRRVGVASALGICSGCVVHTLAAAAGLSAILATSATAFIVVKLVGAAYLIYLGIRFILARDQSASISAHEAPRQAWKAFRQGVVTNVLNPKVALFFLAFLPQFIDRDRTVWTQIAVLGLCWVALGLVSDGAYALAGGTIGRFIRRRQKAVRYASGGIFVGLGAVAATS
jgi:threonine/homoserine/homoserine lactone efflux protein